MRTSFARPSMRFQLTRKKVGGIAGLDIEAGSIAATEGEGANGFARGTASAIPPLEPGAFHQGGVLDPDSPAPALKKLFSPNKPSQRGRPGGGDQRVVRP